MKRIPIYGRDGVLAYALVDNADEKRALRYRWNLDTYGYARTTGKVKVKMHHLIIGERPKGMVVDHVNGLTLDNRRANLRICTQRQNVWNRRGKAGVEIRGVFRCRDKWHARIGIGSTYRYLGTFATREEAWEVRQRAEAERYGKYARRATA